MILTIDIGNTNIVLGGYRAGSLAFMARMTTDPLLEADQYAVEISGILQLYQVSGQEIEGIALSSVVPTLTKVMLEALRHFTKVDPMLLTLADAGNMQICIDNPAELGMDLLASALGVRDSYPLPAVIVDMGTATKLTALDKNGNLQGVSIAPGLFVSLRALVQNASLLGSIALEAPANAIGRNSPESMKSGMVLGTACMVDGLLDLFEKELGGLASVVATGGAVTPLLPCCRHRLQYVPTLILDGLYKAYLARYPA